jgi:hypothetical protein
MIFAVPVVTRLLTKSKATKYDKYAKSHNKNLLTFFRNGYCVPHLPTIYKQ